MTARSSLNLKLLAWAASSVLLQLLLLLLLSSGHTKVAAQSTTAWAEAKRSDFPWMAHLLVRFRSQRRYCAASLVSSRWLLTAASCLESNNAERATSIVARIGKYDLKARTEITQVIRASSNYVIHPNYRRLRWWDYNIALIKVEPPVTSIRALSIPYSLSMCSENYTRYEYPIDSCASVVIPAWTKGHPRLEQNILRKATVDLKRFAYCEQYRRNHYSAAKICAPVHRGTDGKCIGDSGGPLVCQFRDGQKYAIGVTSFGRDECNIALGEPAANIHSRICADLEWATSVIQGRLPAPKVTSCDSPKWVYDGLISPGSNDVGSRRMITCFRDRYLIGNRFIECTGEGKWTTPGQCLMEWPNY